MNPSEKGRKGKELSALINHFHFYLYAFNKKWLSVGMNKLLQGPFFWVILFGLVFLLTQDYMFAHWQDKPLLLGLPNWLFWFMVVHVLFIFTFYFFTEKFWK